MAVAFSGSRKLITGGTGGSTPNQENRAYVWDVDSGRSVSVLKTPFEKEGYIHSLTFIENDREILVGRFEDHSGLASYDAMTGEPTMEADQELGSGGVQSMAINRTFGIIATGSLDGTVKIWDLKSLKFRQSISDSPSAISGRMVRM